MWPSPAGAQTKDDTIVYALQSDVDSWDPPASVLREAIILAFDFEWSNRNLFFDSYKQRLRQNAGKGLAAAE